MQLGQRLDGDVRALERLDAAHEQQQAPVLGQPEGTAGLGAVARAEEGVVHARRHDADAARFAAVERCDLVGLDRARRQHGVGALDDVRLGLGPAVRHVGLDLFGHGFGLDPIERVERAHERQLELVLDHVARQPGQPVVGMDGGVGTTAVVRRTGTGGHQFEDPGGELVDEGGERLLGHRVQRTGGDVVDPQTRLDVDGGREVGRPGPREDVAGDTGAGQRGGELAHVDVHAASVTGARLGQRGRVQGEDGEAAHGG